jgi:C4-dicarboxylate transporter, DctQ subunit
MSALAKMFERGLFYLDRALSAICGIIMISVTVVIFLTAVGRYTAMFSFLGGEELARLMMVWLTFLAAYTMVRTDGHVMIDLVVRAVPPVVQRIFRGLVGLLGAATMIYITLAAYRLAAFSFGTGQTGATLPVPRALFFIPICLGSALMTVAFLEKLVSAILNRLPELPALDSTDEAVR